MKEDSKHADLYAFYCVCMRVDSMQFKSAIEAFMRAEAWPSGVLVKRFLSQKWIGMILHYVHLTVDLLKALWRRIVICVTLCDFVCIQELWLLPTEFDLLNNLMWTFMDLGIMQWTL